MSGYMSIGQFDDLFENSRTCDDTEYTYFKESVPLTSERQQQTSELRILPFDIRENAVREAGRPGAPI